MSVGAATIEINFIPAVNVSVVTSKPQFGILSPQPADTSQIAPPGPSDLIARNPQFLLPFIRSTTTLLMLSPFR